jgi:hypothetical protein
LTGPLPLPLEPEVMVIQGALLTTVQLQLLGATTVMLPVPLLEEKDPLAGEMEYVHDCESAISRSTVENATIEAIAVTASKPGTP